MDKDVLVKRIEAVKTKIEKIQKRIQKHKDNQSEAAFIKETAPWYSSTPKLIKTMDDLAKARWEAVDKRYENDPKYHTTFEDTKKRLQSDFQSHIYGEQQEVRRAERELEEQQQLLAKYEAQLGDKADFEKSDKVEVIWQFLLKWKEDVTKYVIEGAAKIPDLRAHEDGAFKEYCEKHNITQYVSHYKKGFREQYYAGIDPLAFQFYEGHGKVDEKKLEQILNEEIEHKYNRFISQITDICGDIIDASYLKISPKGEINGYVVGTKGKAAIWTTLAALFTGGQRPHYRVYVRKRD